MVFKELQCYGEFMGGWETIWLATEKSGTSEGIRYLGRPDEVQRKRAPGRGMVAYPKLPVTYSNLIS